MKPGYFGMWHAFLKPTLLFGFSPATDNPVWRRRVGLPQISWTEHVDMSSYEVLGMRIGHVWQLVAKKKKVESRREKGLQVKADVKESEER